MRDDFMVLLQLFAEGEGGDGAATGVNTADAGQQRLLELGVPADKIRKNRAYTRRNPEPHAQEATETNGEQAAAAENTEEAPAAESAPKRMSWEEILADPEYKKEYDKNMQGAIQGRLKTAKAAEENLAALAPALELIARKHGQNTENIDYKALAKAVCDDDAMYEELAVQMGTDVNTARKIDDLEREKARNQKQEQQRLEQQKVREHMQGLVRQGDELKKVYPGFDLQKELQNPDFVKWTSPGFGLTAEQAYYALHYKEIQAATAQAVVKETTKRISNDIQSGQRRPAENGASGQAPSVATFDYRKASREQREAFKKRILSEAANGRKVYPGMM